MIRTTAAALLFLTLGACQQEVPADNGAAPHTSTTQAAATRTETERLNDWFDVRFEERLMMSPTALTQLARKERYDEYDDLSEAEGDRQLEWLGRSVAELRSNFDYDALEAEAKTSYDLWIYQYESALEARKFRRRSYVFTQMQGAQSGAAQFLIRFHKVDDESDMRAYIQRIGGISRGISQLLERAKLHAAEGVRPPAFAYEAVIEEATALVTGAPFTSDGEDAPLWADANSKIDALRESNSIDETTAQALRAGVREALLSQFAPSYQGLIDWFNTDIDNADERARGVAALPDGDAYYRQRLKAMTTTDLNPEEIHEIGLREVERITGEMEAIRKRVGFQGNLQEFFAFLKTDDQFYYPNTDSGRQAYIDDTEAYLAFISRRLPDYFGLLPKADLVVKRVEAFREQDGAAQHYSRGAPDGSRPGVYYAHLSDMRAMPKSQMEAVAYHEGNPGHHMQISIAQELTSVPRFRTQSFYTAFTEGWGLYAEQLAKEMGAYQDDYSDFGRLTTEIWRAVRLVVDTGLHAKGWTEEGAVAYFRANTAIADGAARSEVRRYLVWPGQATAYKIGMMKILELREYARKALGDRFDIRAFHDVVLGGGAMPLQILERRVREWVEAFEDETLAE
ncbi:MAG: DUF885 domain-containing protein [Pseudomonadales bacterium]|nr:DUF885 domain-containing protein [Pseudomonadales bacterium]